MLTDYSLRFDHIAVSARTLEEGAAHVRECLGIDMPSGGQHAAMGTHNLLMSLGPDTFLEVIATDPSASPIQRARWFNLDNFSGSARLGTWIVNVKDLMQSCADLPVELGPATKITRGALSWQMAVRDDGSMPFDGAFPMLMQWPDGPHPAARMTDLGCRLEQMTVVHPKATEIQQMLQGQLDMADIHFETSDAMSIRAEIKTPNGIKLLK